MLVDKTIQEEIQNKNIVITPYNPDYLGTNSYDLTLHNKILVYEFPLWKRVLKFIGIDLCHVNPKVKNNTKEIIIPETGYTLKKNQLYIASTVEYTETLNHIPKLEGKSSLGRLGLFIHVTAGYGDVGFKGQWTLELYPTESIKVYPNMKICQISYIEASDKPLRDYGQKPDAKYQNQKEATASKYELNYSNSNKIKDLN